MKGWGAQLGFAAETHFPKQKKNGVTLGRITPFRTS